jgi:hypothetical protein
MALWDKVREELDQAGRIAQGALDEGRLHLELMRARKLADKAAQHLGYAVHRARRAGTPMPDEEMARYVGTLAGHEAEVARLEEQLETARARGRAAGPGSGPAAGTSDIGANI